uniref:ATP synthase F0 subunit 8 n=1 Tax=Ornithoptera alexandrae TaxID=129448 RepID=UPI0024360073|nr:ATP synthase F0 subunit 8 [Ornithoptera alexandrae]WEY05468.1 ATP synthase F0 subunit 8 [Ornithoptera alexandrae]WEY05481.1 ATP synthase F0 subunit 8 [Ornithoptera alexandrae]WEY05494.1 ATP synthase F0 subunit 8 [Ornithoptera alexandrae]WEY05507.1 ATP synthase F0 subunit 8 [Ornithoptera alexandrae]
MPQMMPINWIFFFFFFILIFILFNMMNYYIFNSCNKNSLFMIYKKKIPKKIFYWKW